MRWDETIKRLMLVLALTCACGLLFKMHCAPGGWTEGEQYTTGCYSDAVPFWVGRGVAAGEIPYLQARMEYPVLTGALIWVEGGVTRLLFGSYAGAMDFLLVVTIVNALLAGLVLYMLWRAGMDARRLWGWALAPPLVLYVGHNWDMLAVAMAVAAMLLVRRGEGVKASATAGLGMAAKLFPALMLPLLGLDVLFREGASWPERLVQSAKPALAAIAAWALVNLPVALVAPENWWEFYGFSGERLGTLASVWTMLLLSGILPASIPEQNLLSLLCFVAGAAAIIGIGWRLHRGRLWVLFTPLLAWFLLTNKVYSPQFDLWLYPMLLMTSPRLRPVALFVVADVAAYFAEFWALAEAQGAWPGSLPVGVALAAAVRGAAIVWLIVEAVRLPAPDWLTKTTNSPAAARTET
jgi:uncharacterized membrane protein